MKTLSKSFVYSILIFAISCISLTPFIACSNSDGIDYAEWENTADSWNSEGETNSPFSRIDYLPIEDTEHPYAGIPRIVIETENHRAINDRETKIPAKLQI